MTGSDQVLAAKLPFLDRVSVAETDWQRCAEYIGRTIALRDYEPISPHEKFLHRSSFVNLGEDVMASAVVHPAVATAYPGSNPGAVSLVLPWLGSTTTYQNHRRFDLAQGQAFLVTDSVGDFQSQCSDLFMTLVFAFDREKLAQRSAMIAGRGGDYQHFLDNFPSQLLVAGEDRASRVLLAQIRRLVGMIDRASDSEASSSELPAIGLMLEKAVAMLAFPELLGA